MARRKRNRPEGTDQQEFTAEQLIGFLAKATRPMTLREIAAELDLRHDGRRALAKLSGRLAHRGEIEELSRGRIQLPAVSKRGMRARTPNVARPAPPQKANRPQVTESAAGREPGTFRGRLVAHQDGYGFVVPESPIPGVAGDLFIRRDAMGDAMHGDTVLARVARREADGRADGRIVRVVRRANPSVVGLFRYGSRENVVLPYEPRIPEVVIPPGEELPHDLANKLQLSRPTKPRERLPQLDGAVVNVEVLRYPAGGLVATGRVKEILGRPGEMGVDIEIIIRKHHIPHEFPPDVLAEAEKVAHAPDEATLAGRRDFRNLPIVTIDGETARDFDDAVLAERKPGGWKLQVHIADVAHYVRRGGALDQEARLRGTSVYFPDRAVPMLPEALSNDICSLKPGVDRLVMSALMELDEQGEITSVECAPGVIRSAARMTYTDVHRVIENDPETTARYAHLAENFRTMRDLALVLNARRRKLGSIDFDLPERVIEFDPQGQMTDIVRSERNIAHRLIEEFMLCANQAVARYLEKRGLGFLHRVHEKPDAKKVFEFEELARAFGYTLGIEGLAEKKIQVRHGGGVPKRRDGRANRGGREQPMFVSVPGSMEMNIRPEHFQRLTAKIAGKPEERIISYLMLRSLKQARYAAEPLGHFALAFREYAHFTSPIRRYPDLIVHRVLKWALAHPSGGSGEGTEQPYSKTELEEMAQETSDAERRSVAAERELMDWKTAQFMESRLGDEYDALIISVQKFGFFVELMEVFVEGLVPINRLEEKTGDRCTYRERDHAIVALRRRGESFTWKLGDKVRVVAERIDPLRRRVEFGLV
ncbi:MAG TPA: VacB/RNase II family 3'-5' exoribonuclease [Candidatus Acidoferrales bacterium]|nr:VacB/RNase II family 3'-5' exoribonuclease [Candidatus Acidoferrales bacterium]